jgi:hypothetical protein
MELAVQSASTEADRRRDQVRFLHRPSSGESAGGHNYGDRPMTKGRANGVKGPLLRSEVCLDAR